MKTIQNCDLRFRFQCPKKWDALLPTSNPDVRGCEACARLVYFCKDEAQATEHAKQGHCIAVLAPIAGQPHRLPLAPDADEAGRALLEIDANLLCLIPRDVALKHQVLPLRRSGASLELAMANPSDLFAMDDVAFLTGFRVIPVSAPADSLREAILHHYEEQPEVLLGVMDTGPESEPEPEPEDKEDSSPVARLVRLILANATKKQVERVIFKGDDKSFSVWFERGDSSEEEMKPPRKLWPPVLARLKQITGMQGAPPGHLRAGEAREGAADFSVHLLAEDDLFYVILERV